MFLWQYLLPLILFVVAYWKIFAVVSRQGKAAARRRVTVVTTEPVAETGEGTVETPEDEIHVVDEGINSGSEVIVLARVV